MRDLMHHHKVNQLWRKLEQRPMKRDFRTSPIGAHPPSQPEIANVSRSSRGSDSPRPLRDPFGQPFAPCCGVPDSDLLTGGGWRSGRRGEAVADDPDRLPGLTNHKPSVTPKKGEVLTVDDLLGRVVGGNTFLA